MDRYESRLGELVLAANKAVSESHQIRKGERLKITGGSMAGEFTVDDVSEPDANGAITITFTEVR